MERLLPGRVRPAEHIDVLARHPVHVGPRATVEDARARKGLQRGDPETAVRDPRRQDDRARRDGRSLGQRRDEPVCVGAQPGHVLHEGKPRAEHPRLLVGLPGEHAAAHAAREPEVVPDQRARPCLSPDPVRVDDQRAEPLGGAVDACRQPRGAGADDQQVDVAVAGLDRGPGRTGELDVARVGERGAVREDHHR